MKYKIVPIAHTQVDWKIYIKFIEELLGFSPTRGLDEESVNIKDPAAFLATLSLDNNPLQNLRNCIATNSTAKHIMFSFAAHIDLPMILEISSLYDLKTLYKRDKKDIDYVAIVSGTMEQWYWSIVKGCGEMASINSKQFMTKCLNIFEMFLYKNLWNKFEMIGDKYGHYTLYKKN